MMPLRLYLLVLAAIMPGIAFAGPEIRKEPEIRSAIETGRLTQAQLMIDRLSPEARETATGRGLLADLRLAQKRFDEALLLYQVLAAEDPASSHHAGRTGIALLNVGRTAEAVVFLRKATMLPNSDWRTWNAFGVALDRQGDWAGSEAAYGRALQLAPDRAEIQNNRGYSLLLQRRFAEGLTVLERVAKAVPADGRVSVNLLLARSMAGESPHRAEGEAASVWAARLNNAGYAAWLAGDLPRARSLLTQAIEASETHYQKAVSNLAVVEGQTRN